MEEESHKESVIQEKELNQDDYKNNFATLKKIAEALQNDEQVDIDQLVPMVEKATEAYNKCKTRIETIEKILAEKLRDKDNKKLDSDNS